mmetsp:Transcript_423/g.741  ORF Transcript_423/g.741 Transcript_423/m.741 type:complete len:270 (-) Transcript_423:896-1705(-)
MVRFFVLIVLLMKQTVIITLSASSLLNEYYKVRPNSVSRVSTLCVCRVVVLRCSICLKKRSTSTVDFEVAEHRSTVPLPYVVRVLQYLFGFHVRTGRHRGVLVLAEVEHVALGLDHRAARSFRPASLDGAGDRGDEVFLPRDQAAQVHHTDLGVGVVGLDQLAILEGGFGERDFVRPAQKEVGFEGDDVDHGEEQHAQTLGFLVLRQRHQQLRGATHDHLVVRRLHHGEPDRPFELVRLECEHFLVSIDQLLGSEARELTGFRLELLGG